MRTASPPRVSGGFSNSASTRASTSSDSFRPPAANSLMPLSEYGLCDADTIAAGTSRIAEQNATAGVGTTPRSIAPAPAYASPYMSAACSSGPDARVSRPTMNGPSPRTRAAARPSISAISVVSSVRATPRMPSVPNDSVTGTPGLALGVLRSLAGLLQAVLLALLLAGVAGEEPGPLERDAQLAVELGQRTGDAEAQRAGLPADAAAVDRRVDVVALVGGRQTQRLGDDHPGRLRREVPRDRAPVDDDRAGARAQPDAGGGW